MKYYDEIEKMTCFAGDTLDTWLISTDGDLAGCSMQLILEEMRVPGSAALTRDCILTDDGFLVQLTSSDTAELLGNYRIFFVMTNGAEEFWLKLTGVLEVLPSPKGRDAG